MRGAHTLHESVTLNPEGGLQGNTNPRNGFVVGFARLHVWIVTLSRTLRSGSRKLRVVRGSMGRLTEEWWAGNGAPYCKCECVSRTMERGCPGGQAKKSKDQSCEAAVQRGKHLVVDNLSLAQYFSRALRIIHKFYMMKEGNESKAVMVRPPISLASSWQQYNVYKLRT